MATEDARRNEIGSPRFAEATLFDIDQPVRPYDIHLDSLGAAATAHNEAHNAVQAAEERLTQAMLQARHAGLLKTTIAAPLGISRHIADQPLGGASAGER
ncbi:hypothetical protein FZI88_24315 [Mycobacterium sp. CBMA295]|nr:hypothetical protein [Mycolicibacterium sp. CBMA 295]